MSTGIYTDGNPYGYAININHPIIRPLYLQFKQKNGYRYDEPIPDSERLRFEAEINEKVKKNALNRVTE